MISSVSSVVAVRAGQARVSAAQVVRRFGKSGKTRALTPALTGPGAQKAARTRSLGPSPRPGTSAFSSEKVRPRFDRTTRARALAIAGEACFVRVRLHTPTVSDMCVTVDDGVSRAKKT